MYKAVKKKAFYKTKKVTLKLHPYFVNFGGLLLNAENVMNETFPAFFKHCGSKSSHDAVW